jgi:putative phosphoesterase
MAGFGRRDGDLGATPGWSTKGSVPACGCPIRLQLRMVARFAGRESSPSRAGRLPVLIAVLSDIHDHLPNLRSALAQIAATTDGDGQPVAALICCGDLNSPFVVGELSKGFAGPITIVFGNNDGDRFRITSLAAAAPNVTVAGESASLELGGKRVFVHHFNDVGAIVAAAGQHDLVCYGHNHEFLLRRGETGTVELNPGAIMGWRPGVGDVPATYALYDTDGTAVIRDALSGAEITRLDP